MSKTYFKKIIKCMKSKRFATYPIAFMNNISDKIFNEKDRVFDDKSRVSYFRSLEVAQQNLNKSTEKSYRG